MRHPSRCPPSSAVVERSGGSVRGGHHLDRAIVDALADDLGVETSGAGLAKVPAQPVNELGRRVEVDAEAAARPERELDQALEHAEVVFGGARRARGKQVGREAGDRAVPLLEREARPDRPPGVARVLLERPPGRRGRAEARVEDRRDSGNGQRETQLGVMVPHSENLGSRRARSSCRGRLGLLERRALERLPARPCGSLPPRLRFGCSGKSVEVLAEPPRRNWGVTADPRRVLTWT